MFWHWVTTHSFNFIVILVSHRHDSCRSLCPSGWEQISRKLFTYSLLYGLPQAQTDKIQRVQNAAARLISSNRSSAISHRSYISFTGFQLSTVLNSKFCSLLLKLFTAWFLITSVHWSVENHLADIHSDPAKELVLRFVVARSFQHLEKDHFVMQPRISGTICPLK